jgi:hypothetical protein
MFTEAPREPMDKRFLNSKRKGKQKICRSARLTTTDAKTANDKMKKREKIGFLHIGCSNEHKLRMPEGRFHACSILSRGDTLRRLDGTCSNGKVL